MSEETDQKRPPVGYTLEGGGVVTTCKGCGWVAWRETRAEAEKAWPEHKTCPKYMVKLYAKTHRKP